MSGCKTRFWQKKQILEYRLYDTICYSIIQIFIYILTPRAVSLLPSPLRLDVGVTLSQLFRLCGIVLLPSEASKNKLYV